MPKNEIRQPGGRQAKHALPKLLNNHSVKLRANGKDRYGRTLGILMVGGLNIDLAMAREGWAWAYQGFTSQLYAQAQNLAKKARRGLWALPDGQREPPWQFRHQHEVR